MSFIRHLGAQLATPPKELTATGGTVNGINLGESIKSVTTSWQTNRCASFNGHDVVVARMVSGGWHKHADTDEFVLVLQGRVSMELRVETIHLGPGELIVIPAGVEHRPIVEGDAYVLLIEPGGPTLAA